MCVYCVCVCVWVCVCPNCMSGSRGQIAEGAGATASLQQQLENVLGRKAAMLQSITALESALEDARNQISDAVRVRTLPSFSVSTSANPPLRVPPSLIRVPCTPLPGNAARSVRACLGGHRVESRGV